MRRWPGYLVFLAYVLACGLVGGAAPDRMTWILGELVLLYVFLAIVASTWDYTPKSRA